MVIVESRTRSLDLARSFHREVSRLGIQHPGYSKVHWKIKPDVDPQYKVATKFVVSPLSSLQLQYPRGPPQSRFPVLQATGGQNRIIGIFAFG